MLIQRPRWLLTEHLHSRYILFTKDNVGESSFSVTAHEQTEGAANYTETSWNKCPTGQLLRLTDIRSASKERNQ
jgi:hypothetical protein